MEVRRLGRTDLEVSSIGLGCVTFGREIDAESSFAVMDHARERGINLFDTAEAYGGGASEEVVGRWLRDRGARDEVVLATKVAGHLTRDHILESAEASLRRLQVEQVDLFQLHRFDPEVPLEEMLAAMQEVVDRGWARYIGCSNFAAWQLCKSLWQQDVHNWARFESVQPNYNLVERNIEQEMIPLCVDQEIGIVSYSPLGAGFLTGKYRQNEPLPEGARFDLLPAHQNIYFKPDGWRVVEGLRAKSAELDIPMIRLAMAWVINQPHITSVLVGARNTNHVEQAFEAEAMAMPDELREELGSL